MNGNLFLRLTFQATTSCIVCRPDPNVHAHRLTAFNTCSQLASEGLGLPHCQIIKGIGDVLQILCALSGYFQ